jgi:hypothetical protein
LRGTGWAGFLLGRGRGIWMAGAEPAEQSTANVIAEIRKFGRNVYSNDLGEEHLCVAPYLHRGLGADVLYTHARKQMTE